jgi:hypothetical protein
MHAAVGPQAPSGAMVLAVAHLKHASEKLKGAEVSHRTFLELVLDRQQLAMQILHEKDGAHGKVELVQLHG